MTIPISWGWSPPKGDHSNHKRKVKSPSEGEGKNVFVKSCLQIFFYFVNSQLKKIVTIKTMAKNLENIGVHLQSMSNTKRKKIKLKH